ncbi:lytic transglycosylase domain-containing protein [Thiomonas sp.]
MVGLPPPIPAQFAVCAERAAARYHLPAQLVEAIIHQESGRVGHVVWDRNGTYDIGPMQVNSCWLSKLAQYGITRPMVEGNACENIAIGSWILARNLAHYGVTGTNYVQHPAQLGYAIMAYNIGTRWTADTYPIGLRYARSVLIYWHGLYRETVAAVRAGSES